MSRRFTDEQRAAIEDRAGAGLLAANAGSGKTAVMVERFAASVLEDEVPVGAILALTFTEKAAGELRERVRRRFADAGEAEHAREAEAAWIGTIHGFCARVLRAHPLAAGLDPGFDVLDEPAARRLRDAAWDDAVEAWSAARGRAALELLAAQPQDALRLAVENVYAELRSRGERHPTLPDLPPASPPDAPGLLDAARAALRAIADAKGVTAGRARDALETAIAALERRTAAPDGGAAGGVDAAGGGGAAGGGAAGGGDAGSGELPRPGELDEWVLPRGGKALDDDACVAYRAAYADFRAACADAHARPMLGLAGDLLERFARACEALKAERAAVDFEDLQLLVRDLFAGDAALRTRWSERFERIMVDEFQDTNRLQLAVLEQLERGNLFAVGDEFQSIYGFRHADVTIFRERAATLGAGHVRRLRANFRSDRALLDVLNGAFTGVLGEGFEPLVAGREPDRARPADVRAAADDSDGAAGLRLFDPDHVPVVAARPAVELLLTDTRDWDAIEDAEPPVPGEQPWRRAEARVLARRLREEVDAGRRPGEIAVLVRAASSLRPIEAALEEAGLATYVVGGRGYWSQEQVRDGLAWLSVLANPFDEQALYAVLASPFAAVSVDGLALTAQAAAERAPDGTARGAWSALVSAFARATAAPEDADTRGATGAREDANTHDGAGAHGHAGAYEGADMRGGAGEEDWVERLPPHDRAALERVVPLLAAEREHAERVSAETLLERAAAGTGYDLAILARPGGERRLANLRKLMRLAREYERSEGRDLRGLLAYAAAQDVAAVREGEAALESEGLDAVRLMTVHRAKGLEFPVVCVADLGRSGRRADPPLLVGGGGRAGVRLRNLGDAMPDPALAWTALRDEKVRAEDEEERRLLYVACTRAEQTLILSAGLDPTKPPVAKPGAPPIAWVLPAFVDDPAVVASDAALAGETLRLERTWDGRPAPLGLRLTTAHNTTLTPAPRATPAGPGTALPALPAVGRPVAPPAAMAPPMAGLPRRLSYSSLGDYGRCAYRWYLKRVLNLPGVPPPPPLVDAADAPAAAAEPEEPGLDARTRGSIVHALLEELDARRPIVPTVDAVVARGPDFRVELTTEEAEDIRGLVERFATSRLRERLARATRVRREARFAFPLEPGPEGLLVHGVVDVIATEAENDLVVDYKSDRLDGLEPHELTERDYAGQRLVYALAALRGGADTVEVAHCYLERPDEPAVAVFTQQDAPRMAEELLGLARGILAGRFPVTDDPGHDLCASCPGRAALCSHPETVTLRPR